MERCSLKMHDPLLKAIECYCSQIPTLGKKGVLVYCTKENEWALPWWKINYLIKNTLPVAFIDAGISSKAKKWCKNTGHLIEPKKHRSLSSFLTLKDLSIIASPFDETLFLDPFLQIKFDRASLFEFLDETRNLAVAPSIESTTRISKELVVFKKTPLLTQWMLNRISEDALLKNPSVSLLSEFFNWPFEERGSNLFAMIVNRKGTASLEKLKEDIQFLQEELMLNVNIST